MEDYNTTKQSLISSVYPILDSATASIKRCEIIVYSVKAKVMLW